VGTRIAVQPLPEDMIRPGVSVRAREFLEGVGDDMRQAASSLSAAELVTSL